MADGKITFSIDADVKDLRKKLREAEKEYLRSQKALHKTELKQDIVHNRRKKEFEKSEIAQRLRNEEKDIAVQEKLVKKGLEKVKAIKEKYPGIKDLSDFSTKKGVNKGLLTIKANKLGIPLDELERYKEITADLGGSKNTLSQLKEQLKITKHLYNLEKEKLYEPTKEQTGLEEDAILNEQDLNNAREQYQAINAELSKAVEKQARLQKMQKIISKLQHPFKNMAKSLKLFNRRLRYAIVQGLLLRPLRQAFFGIYEAMAQATKQNSLFSKSMANLKGTIWTALTPAFNALMPILANFLNMVANITTYIGALINAIFGLKPASKSAAQSLANSAKKGAGDKNFAKWDTVQQLKKKDANAPIAPTFEQDFSKAEAAIKRLQDILASDGWYGVGEEIGRQISDAIASFDAAELAQKISSKIISALQFVSGLISGIDFKVLGEKLREFIANIDWIGLAQEAVRLLGEALIGALEFLEGLLGVGVFQGLFQGLADAVRWALDAIMELFDLISGKTSFEEFFNELSTGQHIFLAFAGALLVAKTAMLAFSLAQKGITAAQKGLSVATGLVSKAFTFMTSPIGIGILAITGIIAAVVLLAKHWDQIKAKTIEVWTAISDKIVAVKEKVHSVFDSFKEFIKGIINSVIGMVESAVNWIIEKLNTLHWTIPDWVPLIGGKSWGFNFDPIEIPRLAQGAVVNPGHEFTAILGDNRREQEIVSPLSTMKEALMEALQESGFNRSGTVVMNIDGNTFARVTYPYNQREIARVGIKATGG